MTATLDLVPLQARFSSTSNLPTTTLLLEMLAVVYIVSALAYVTYGLRMYSRITSKQLGLEDWLMTAAMMFSIPLVSLQYFYYKLNYVGVPYSELQDAPSPTISTYLSEWLNQVLYSPILGLVKASTLVFMLRISGHMRNVKRTIYVINTINIALTISQCIATICITVPIASYWDSHIRAKHRIDSAAFITSTSALVILTDLSVLFIPFWVFIRTQLPTATRCGVIMVFMTGGLVTAIGIIRVCVYADAFYESQEYLFTVSWGPALNAIETSLAIMTASLPTLSPLLRKWFPRLFRNCRSGVSGQARYYKQRGSGNGRTVKMTDFSRRHPSARSASHSTTESQQGMFDPAGIRKTTDIQVAYSNRSLVDGHAGEPGQAGRSLPSDPALMV